MGNKQIIFSLTVGIALILAGAAITQISPAGWSLLAVGLGLSGLSLGVKLYHQLTPATSV